MAAGSLSESSIIYLRVLGVAVGIGGILLLFVDF